MTNLSLACKTFGWAGGTIHQVRQELNYSGRDLVSMPQEAFKQLLKQWKAKNKA